MNNPRIGSNFADFEQEANARDLLIENMFIELRHELNLIDAQLDTLQTAMNDESLTYPEWKKANDAYWLGFGRRIGFQEALHLLEQRFPDNPEVVKYRRG